MPIVELRIKDHTARGLHSNGNRLKTLVQSEASRRVPGFSQDCQTFFFFHAGSMSSSLWSSGSAACWNMVFGCVLLHIHKHVQTVSVT